MKHNTVSDVRNDIINMQYQGIMGEITFSSKGNIIMPVGIKNVKNGKFVWVDFNDK